MPAESVRPAGIRNTVTESPTLKDRCFFAVIYHC
jgi:hypothetical protein